MRVVPVEHAGRHDHGHQVDLPGTDSAGTERTPYQEKCTQTRDGVEFTVTGVASSSTQTTANGGMAQWTGIQPGLVTISEHIPEGYGQPVVFCTGPKINTNFPVANGAIEFELYAGGYLTCDWYNVPLEKGKVVVHKGVCPEGTTGEHDALWYITNCDKPLEGVEFTLTHGAGGVPGTTDASGNAEWTDVPLGPYSLQEHIPAGYGDPIVSCTSEADTMLTTSSGVTIARGGYFEGELTSPRRTITCYWFNIPAGKNSIRIHKYTCPEGYDPHAWNADPKEDCEEGPNGVTFDLGGAATGSRRPPATRCPSPSFSDLPIGTYTVTEQVPDGTGTVFVWDCTGQRTGELRPTPLATGPHPPARPWTAASTSPATGTTCPGMRTTTATAGSRSSSTPAPPRSSSPTSTARSRKGA